MVENNSEVNIHAMNPIGGYFELELARHDELHGAALHLNSARNCLEYVILARQYKKLYIPYFTCEVVLEPLRKHNVEYEFYSINELLEPEKLVTLKADEAFLYTNYFGLKQNYAESISKVYGSQLIVDNAQALYANRIEGIDTFYSPRKFMGVPDGGYLYSDSTLDGELSIGESAKHCQYLLGRIERGPEPYYAEFKKAESSLENQEIMAMSRLTRRLLESVDYAAISKRRRTNFMYLHEKLSATNRLNVCLDKSMVPMIYPYFTEDDGLRQKLIENKVFVATYWPNVFEWCSDDSIEYLFAKNIIPLPIDQRYGAEDMDRILDIVKLVCRGCL